MITNDLANNDKWGQSGAALVVSLLLLMVMTLIGITAMQSTSLEEKMSGNLRDRDLAMQSAESALRKAESSLLLTAVPAPPVFSCGSSSDGLYLDSCSPTAASLILDSFWAGTDNLAFTGTDLTGSGTARRLSTNPQYIMEKLSSISNTGSLETGIAADSNYYRLTAKGTGGTATSVVIVQSVFKP